MSLETYNHSIQKAKKVVESAATVAELTRQAKKTRESAPKETTFVVPADRINLGTLKQRVKSQGSWDAEIVDNGDTYEITTSNPTQVTRILKLLGIATTVKGDTVDNQLANFELALDNDSTNGTIGESVRKKK